MEELKLIKLSPDELTNLPLYYRKIFYNVLTNSKEDKKLIKYSANFQCNIMCDNYSAREISKSINHKIFSKNE